MNDAGLPSACAVAADAAELARLDERARHEALDANHSILLQAPAGSGKTTVLTARFLTLLSRAEEPEEILAITFTRKAAAEMRQRILGALREAGAPHGIEPQLPQAARLRDRERGWNLTQHPARLRIETIDAMNARLARALPVSARAGGTLQIARSAPLLYREAARRALEGAWLEPSARPAATVLFERLDDSWSRLQRLLAGMLERRTHWLPHVLPADGAQLVRRVQESLQSLLSDELSELQAYLPPELLRAGWQILAQTRRAQGRVLGVPSNEPASLPDWRELCELALTGRGWRRSFTQQQGFERGAGALKQDAAAWIDALARLDGAEPRLRRVLALPDERLPQADQVALQALAGLLVRAAAQLQLVFAERGRVDYTYVAGAARAALTEQGEPTELALRTGTALRHLLVDEFQDVSFEQFELLRALTVGWEPGDGRTLFLVGDPMQSIYQFREAQVGLFLRARTAGVGAVALRALQLRRNFRVRVPLLDWINTHFAQLFPRDDDARLAAVRYLPSVAVHAAAPAGGAPVSWHRFDTDDRRGEARRVLQIIREVRGREPVASVAVLVASREHAVEIVEALRAAGVPLRGVDLQPLRDRPVVRDLAALARALLHGADRTAWLAVLRAPWCALTLEQLEALCAQDRGDLFATACELAGASPPAADGAAALARLCRALAPALQGAERALPLWQRVERCWLRLAGPAIYRREIDRLDARRFLEALALYEDTDELAGEAMVQLTRQLYSTEPVRAGAVEIMTMHAAKGLEWDVVILPGLGRRTAVDQDPLLHWIELPRAGTDEQALLLSPIRAAGVEPARSLAAYIKRLRRERVRIERVRLLYVAATRARRALHLCAALPPARATGASTAAPSPAEGSLLQLLWPAVGPQFTALPVASPPAGTALAAVAGDTVAPGAADGDAEPAATLWRLPAHWLAPRPPPAPRPLRLPPGATPAEQVPEYRWVGMAARAVGTIVHAELHRLALAAPLPPPASALRPPAQYELWLAELGVESLQRAAARADILQALVRTLEDPRGRWLLAGTHRQAHSEWRLSGLHAGRRVNVVVDRMLLDEQGHRWVVDFKTSRHEGGAVEQFIDSELERYRPQLTRYAALARELGPEPVHAALYFPLLGVFRELPPPTAAG